MGDLYFKGLVTVAGNKLLLNNIIIDIVMVTRICTGEKRTQNSRWCYFFRSV